MRESSISDQKRLVRKLHWEHARGILRVRDKVHHRPWRLLTIAGPAPHEEINCIRAQMHQAHITSVDIERANLEAAIEAGADEVIHCDIGDLRKIVEPGSKSSYNNYQNPDRTHYEPPKCLCDVGPFDVVCLDLTGPANDWLKLVVQTYFRTGFLNKGGALIVTFSYGRDVLEVYQYEWAGVHEEDREILREIPEVIASRVWYALRARIKKVESCLQYHGAKMPMVSCLLRNGSAMNVSFKQLGDLDYGLAVAAVEEDAGKQFACPADRIEELRARYGRREIARKAVETRRLRENKQPQLRLVEGSKTLAIVDGTKQGDWQHGAHIDSLPTHKPSRVGEIERLWDECSDDERAKIWHMLHLRYLQGRLVSSTDTRARTALLEEIQHDAVGEILKPVG